MRYAAAFPSDTFRWYCQAAGYALAVADKKDMRLFRRKWRLIATLILGFVGVALTWLNVPRPRYYEEICACERLVDRIEALRRTQGHFPDKSLFPETEGRLFYRPVGNEYVVGFSLGFDDYELFDSRTRRWSFDASH